MDLRQVLKNQLSDKALEEISNKVTAEDLMHLLENYMGDEMPFIEGRKWSVPTQEPYFKQFVKNVLMKEKKYMKMIFAFYMSNVAEQKLQCLRALIAQSKEDYEKNLDALTVVDVEPEEKGASSVPAIPVHLQTEQLINNSTSGEPDAGLHLSLEVQLKLVQQGVLQKRLSDVIQHMKETLIIYEELNSDVKMNGNQYTFVMTYRGQIIVSATANTQLQAQKQGHLQFLQKYASKIYDHFKPSGVTTTDKKNSYVSLFNRKAEHPQQSRFGVILTDAVDDLLQGKLTTSSSTLKKPNKQQGNQQNGQHGYQQPSQKPSIQVTQPTEPKELQTPTPKEQQPPPPKEQQPPPPKDNQQLHIEPPQLPQECQVEQPTQSQPQQDLPQLGFSSAQPQIDDILSIDPTFGLPGSQEILFESKPQMEEEQQQQQQQQPQLFPTEDIVENKQFQLRDLIVNIEEPKYDIFDEEIQIDEQKTTENHEKRVEDYHKILDLNPPGVSLVVPQPQHLKGPQYLNSKEEMLVRLHQVTKLDIDTQKLDGLPLEALDDERFVMDVIAIANILKQANKNKYTFQVVIEQVRYENDKVCHRALMIVSKVGRNPDQEQFQLEEEKESHLKVKAYLMIIKVMLRKCYSDQSPPTRFLKIVNYVISKLKKKEERKPSTKRVSQTQNSAVSSMVSTPNPSPPALITQLAPNFFQTLQEFTSKKKPSPRTKNQKIAEEKSTVNQHSQFYQSIMQQIKHNEKEKDQEKDKDQQPPEPIQQQQIHLPKLPTQLIKPPQQQQQQQHQLTQTSKLLQSLQLPKLSPQSHQQPKPTQIPQIKPPQPQLQPQPPQPQQPPQPPLSQPLKTQSPQPQPAIKKKSPPKTSKAADSSIDSKELESSTERQNQNNNAPSIKKVGRPPKTLIIKPTKKTKLDESNKPHPQQQPQPPQPQTQTIQFAPIHPQEPPQELIDMWTKPNQKQNQQPSPPPLPPPPRQNFHANTIQPWNKHSKDYVPASERMSIEQNDNRKHDSKHNNPHQTANRKERNDNRNQKKSQNQSQNQPQTQTQNQNQNHNNPRYRTDSRNKDISLDDDSDYIKTKNPYRKKKDRLKNDNHKRRDRGRNSSRARARSREDYNSSSPKRYNHRYDKLKKLNKHHHLPPQPFCYQPLGFNHGQGFAQSLGLSYGQNYGFGLGHPYHPYFAPPPTMLELTSMVTQLICSMNQMMMTFTKQMSRR